MRWYHRWKPKCIADLDVNDTHLLTGRPYCAILCQNHNSDLGLPPVFNWLCSLSLAHCRHFSHPVGFLWGLFNFRAIYFSPNRWTLCLKRMREARGSLRIQEDTERCCYPHPLTRTHGIAFTRRQTFNLCLWLEYWARLAGLPLPSWLKLFLLHIQLGPFPEGHAQWNPWVFSFTHLAPSASQPWLSVYTVPQAVCNHTVHCQTEEWDRWLNLGPACLCLPFSAIWTAYSLERWDNVLLFYIDMSFKNSPCLRIVLYLFAFVWEPCLFL